jgi:hypothetical protein
MSTSGTLNDFLCAKVREIVSELQEQVNGRQNVEVGHFKKKDNLSHDQVEAKHGAWVSTCKVLVDEAGSAVAFSGQLNFTKGAVFEALNALRVGRQIRFQFDEVDYSQAGIDFHGVHLAHSPLNVSIIVDPKTLDKCYDNDGLVDSIKLEFFRYTDL